MLRWLKSLVFRKPSGTTFYLTEPESVVLDRERGLVHRIHHFDGTVTETLLEVSDES